MRTVLLIAAVLGCVLTPSLAKVGVDVSSAVGQSAWKCLQSPGGQGPVELALVRVYRSYGSVDPNAAATIANANNAGIPRVDGYIFPCVSCGDPAGQVEDAVNATGDSVSVYWYDIENYKWSTDVNANREFIKAMVDYGKRRGINAGIYTNLYNWESITGGKTWNYPSSQGLPLWYAHYDGNPSFSDFQAFGGWRAPFMKQYLGDKTSCGVSLDYNFF